MGLTISICNERRDNIQRYAGGNDLSLLMNTPYVWEKSDLSLQLLKALEMRVASKFFQGQADVDKTVLQIQLVVPM